MSIAQLLWYCAYCGNGPYVQEISDFCLICNSRQDGYSQDIRVSLPEPPVWDAHFQPLSHPQSPQEGTDGETVSLPPSPRRDSGFERGNLETESLESPTNTSRRARAPNDSLSIQEESLGLLEKCIFNLPDLASRPWMPRSRTVYPGQSCFSLETGKPSVAPKRRPDSPTRKAEVAFVRGQGACGACRKNKKACRHLRDVCRETDAPTQGSTRVPAKRAPFTTNDDYTDIGSPVEHSSAPSALPGRKLSNRGSTTRARRVAPGNLKQMHHTPRTTDTQASAPACRPEPTLLSQPGRAPTLWTRHQPPKQPTTPLTPRPKPRTTPPQVGEAASSAPPEPEPQRPTPPISPKPRIDIFALFTHIHDLYSDDPPDDPPGATHAPSPPFPPSNFGTPSTQHGDSPSRSDSAAPSTAASTVASPAEGGEGKMLRRFSTRADGGGEEEREGDHERGGFESRPSALSAG
ncbi:hypothetical protein MMC15_002637 [Xylographa vitiligo]|nr:hypothetical protein [Xylographa vitiligo]